MSGPIIRSTVSVLYTTGPVPGQLWLSLTGKCQPILPDNWKEELTLHFCNPEYAVWLDDPTASPSSTKPVQRKYCVRRTTGAGQPTSAAGGPVGQGLPGSHAHICPTGQKCTSVGCCCCCLAVTSFPNPELVMLLTRRALGTTGELTLARSQACKAFDLLPGRNPIWQFIKLRQNNVWHWLVTFCGP